MKTIYKTQKEHTLIKEISEKGKIYVSSSYDKDAHIAAHPSSLEDVVRFYQDNFKAKLHVLAITKKEAQIALESNCNFTYQSEFYDIASMARDDIELLKLKLSSTDCAKNNTYRYITTTIRNHGVRRSPGDIAQAIHQYSAFDSESIIGIAQKKFSEIEKRTKAALSVTNREGMDVRKVSSKDEVCIDEILNGGIFIDATGTGFGKTEKAEAILNKAARGLYVTHRRSIVQASIPFATHYERINIGSEAEIQTVKTVINSIGKPQVQEFINCAPLDVLVIDEVAQVLRHIAEGAFDGKNDRVTAWEKLSEALKRARVIYIADADTADFVIDYVKSIRKNEKIVMFESGRSLAAEVVIENFEDAEAAAVSEIYNGKAFIATDSKTFVCKHALRANNEGVKGVIGITSDSIGNYAGILEDTKMLSNFSSLMFSPAITSSVSIVDGGFTDHYGLFNGIITSGDAVQMLRRERTATKFIVGVKPCREILIDKAEEILLKNSGEPTEFDRFAARIEADSNFIRNNISASLSTALELAGFKVTIGSLDNQVAKFKAKGINASASQYESIDHKKELLSAVSADRKNIKKARGNGEMDSITGIEVERAELEKTVGTSNITEQHIKDWQCGDLAGQIRNLEIARLSLSDAENKNLLEKNKKRASRDRFNYLAHRELLSLVLDTLNISKETLMGSFTTDDANQLGEILHERRVEFNRLTLKNKLKKTPAKHFTRTAKKLLSEFGLSTGGGVTSTVDGVMMNTYTVTKASAERVLRYLDKRKVVEIGE